METLSTLPVAVRVVLLIGYLLSCSIASVALGFACVAQKYKTKAWNSWFIVIQSCAIWTLAMSFCAVLSTFADTANSRIFYDIFAIAYGVVMGFMTVGIPYFMYYSLNLKWGFRQRFFFYLLGILYFTYNLLDVLSFLPFAYGSNIVFEISCIYCIIKNWKSIHNIQDSHDKAVFLTVNIVSLSFIPLAVVSYIFPEYVSPFTFAVYVVAFAIIAIVYYAHAFSLHSKKLPVKKEITLDSLSCYSITEREFEVVIQIISGKSNKEIAQALNISVNTVTTHVANIFAKMKINTRSELLRLLCIGPWA